VGEIAPKRVMIFIDGSNLYHALKERHGKAGIAFEHLAASLVGAERDLVRVYYYNAPVNAAEVPAQAKAQQRFFSALRRQDYFEIRLGRLEKRPNGAVVEKGVDVLLATDMVAAGFRNQFDVAVLVSGDGDFAAAVQIVKDLGKHVELAFPRCRARANRLVDECDKVVELTEPTHLKFL